MKIKSYNAKNSDVYHNNSDCTEGNNIERVNLQQGTGGKRLCKKCANLNSPKK